MTPVQIKGWKTSDGRIFENEEEAIKHENYIFYYAKIANFVDEHFHSHNTIDQIVNIMMKHTTELEEIFNRNYNHDRH